MGSYVKIDKDKLTEEQKKNLSFFELSETQEKLIFIQNSFDSRKFFDTKNNTIISEDNRYPLLTWPFLDFIANLDLAKTKIYELGSGFSTLFFQNIFKFIESYETDENWFNEISKKIDNKSHIIKLISEKDIIDNLSKDLHFKNEDWLLVDFAGHRTKFIHNLVSRDENKLPAHIILDNSDWYKNGRKLLTKAGYTEIPFWGYKTGENFISCTSVFILKNLWSLKTKNTNFSVKGALIAKNNTWDNTE